MILPSWDDLIPEQRDVLDIKVDEPLFVVGPPGSGKTSLAIARARMVANAKHQVTIITYNRMLRRLVSLLEKLDAQTMQRLIGRDYYHRTREKTPKLPHDAYAYDWDTMLATLKVHPDRSPGLDHVVIDEGQDLHERFFVYARRHLAKVMSVFADEDQALGEDRTTIKQIQKAGRLPEAVILTVNHRNSPEIAAVAEHFHSGHLPAAIVKRPVASARPRLIQDASLAATCQRVATWVQTRGGTVGVVVHRNPTGAKVHQRLSDLLPGTRVDIYTSDAKDEEHIQLLQPGVTILNEKSVKGQEFDAVFVIELERFLPCDTARQKRILYMLCARARDMLFLISGVVLSKQSVECLPPKGLLERG